MRNRDDRTQRRAVIAPSPLPGVVGKKRPETKWRVTMNFSWSATSHDTVEQYGRVVKARTEEQALFVGFEKIRESVTPGWTSVLFKLERLTEDNQPLNLREHEE